MAGKIDSLRRKKEQILRRIEDLKSRSVEAGKEEDVRVSAPGTAGGAPANRGADFTLGKHLPLLAVLLILGILGLNTTLGIWAVTRGFSGGSEPGPVLLKAPVEVGPAEIAEVGGDKVDEEGPTHLLKRAEELLEKGRVGEIPPLFKGRIPTAPAALRKRMWLVLGRAYQAQGKTGRSLEALLRASGSDGSSQTLEGLFAAADSYFKEGRFEEASHLYYTFLAQADRLPLEAKDLEARAYFRLAQALKGRAVRGGEAK